MLEGQGFHSLAFYPDYFPQLALSLTAVRRPWAMENADVLKAFLRAQANAIHWLYDPANKTEALDLLMKETRSDLASAEHSYDIYLAKLHMFPANGCIQPKGIEALIGVMSRINKTVKADLPASKYIDTRWCP